MRMNPNFQTLSGASADGAAPKLPSSFAESTRLLDAALRRECENRPLSFYGLDHVAAAVGDGYEERFSSAGFGDYDVPDALALSGQRFVLVGYEPFEDGEPISGLVEKLVPSAVLLAGTAVRASELMPPMGESAMRSSEHMRLRSGLMTRDTAELLLSHVERYCRRSSYGETLSWQVVEGPSITQSARDWLDSIGATDALLRSQAVGHWSRGLCDGLLAVLRMQGECRLVPFQTFSYRAMLMRLPARYFVSAIRTRNKKNLPPEFRVTVRRKAECERAVNASHAFVDSGVLAAAKDATPERRFYRDLEDRFAQELWPFFDEIGAKPMGVPAYARALARDELMPVIKELRRRGYRGVKVHHYLNEEVKRGLPPWCKRGPPPWDNFDDSIEGSSGSPVASEPRVPVRMTAVLHWPVGLPEEQWPRWARVRWGLLDEEVTEVESQHNEAIDDADI